MGSVMFISKTAKFEHFCLSRVMQFQTLKKSGFFNNTSDSFDSTPLNPPASGGKHI